MPEEQQNQQQEEKQEVVKAPEVREGVTIVTSENLAAFQAQQLDLKDPVKAEEPKAEEPKPEEPKPEEKKPEEKNPEEKKEEQKPRELSKLEKRFHDITEQRKAAEARAEAAERKAAELEAKYNPPKTPAGQKPSPNEYSSIDEYSAALEKWAADNAVRQREAEIAREQAIRERNRQVEQFKKNEREAKEAYADYDEVIESSDVRVSDELMAAIFESDAGPQLRYHLAKNPDEAERLGKMTVGGMLREVGRLEARLTQPQRKSDLPKVEISKAPEPITPLRGGNAVVDLPINSKGEWTGTLDEYKAARRAGKIR